VRPVFLNMGCGAGRQGASFVEAQIKVEAR